MNKKDKKINKRQQNKANNRSLIIDAGIKAREQAKATSRAAERRNMRFGEFQVEEAETVEDRLMRGTAKPIANDPIDW